MIELNRIDAADLLGIELNSTSRAVKTAYRKLVLNHNVSDNMNNKSDKLVKQETEFLVQINKAYEILTSTVLEKSLDEILKETMADLIITPEDEKKAKRKRIERKARQEYKRAWKLANRVEIRERQKESNKKQREIRKKTAKLKKRQAAKKPKRKIETAKQRQIRIEQMAEKSLEKFLKLNPGLKSGWEYDGIRQHYGELTGSGPFYTADTIIIYDACPSDKDLKQYIKLAKQEGMKKIQIYGFVPEYTIITEKIKIEIKSYA